MVLDCSGALAKNSAYANPEPDMRTARRLCTGSSTSSVIIEELGACDQVSWRHEYFSDKIIACPSSVRCVPTVPYVSAHIKHKLLFLQKKQNDSKGRK